MFSSSTGRSRIAVLFVDDDPQVLRTLSRSFKAWNESWQMKFALGGSAAVQALREQTFDILVTDLEMPEVDGRQVIAFARQIHPSIRCVLHSGSEFKDERIEGCILLSKPAPVDEMRRLLAELANETGDPNN